MTNPQTSRTTVPVGARNSLIVGLPTLLGVLIVLIFGGITVLTHDISWHQYQHDASILIGLLGIGYGIDRSSKP